MKKIYILFISIALIFSACTSSLLDIDNPNEAPSKNYWKTALDAESGIKSCYSAFYKEGTWMRWLSFRYDLTSDEGYSSSPWIELGDWTRFSYINYNFLEGNNMHWEHFYMGIFRCNQVLKYVPDIEMDSEQKATILAQAHFLRALWYFQVNLLWEKGPLVLEPKGVDYTPQEVSTEAIWAQIEIDLKAALEGDALPEEWGKDDIGRVTKGAVKALLGKAYMQQHKFNEAKAELQWLINMEGSIYNLTSIWEDNFRDIKNNNESVFKIQFDGTNKGGTGNTADMATGFQRTQFYAPNGIGWSDGKARRWLVDEFLKETTIDATNDTRLYNSILYRDFYKDFPDEDIMYYAVNAKRDWDHKDYKWGDDCYIRKYNTAYYRDYEDYFGENDYHIIRYSDVLLNYAECIIETGGSTAQAAVYVDKVRNRAKLKNLSTSIYASSLNSKDAFMKRLQMERTLELCFEGWRWADLKRWGMLDNQTDIDELKTRDTDFNNFIIGKHNRMPIPQIEVDNSEGGLTQNPKY